MENTKIIECPKCGNKIDVNQALVDLIKEEYQTKYTQKLMDIKKTYDAKYSDLKKLNELIEKKKTNLTEAINKGIRKSFHLKGISWKKISGIALILKNLRK